MESSSASGLSRKWPTPRVSWRRNTQTGVCAAKTALSLRDMEEERCLPSRDQANPKSRKPNRPEVRPRQRRGQERRDRRFAHEFVLRPRLCLLPNQTQGHADCEIASENDLSRGRLASREPFPEKARQSDGSVPELRRQRHGGHRYRGPRNRCERRRPRRQLRHPRGRRILPPSDRTDWPSRQERRFLYLYDEKRIAAPQEIRKDAPSPN